MFSKECYFPKLRVHELLISYGVWISCNDIRLLWHLLVILLYCVKCFGLQEIFLAIQRLYVKIECWWFHVLIFFIQYDFVYQFSQCWCSSRCTIADWHVVLPKTLHWTILTPQALQKPDPLQNHYDIQNKLFTNVPKIPKWMCISCIL